MLTGALSQECGEMRQSATRERYDQSASTLLSWAANYRQDNQDQPKPPIVDKDTPRIQGEQIDSISFMALLKNEWVKRHEG